MGEYKIGYEPVAHAVLVRHTGVWNRDESNQNLERILAMCRERDTGRVLVDHRGSHVDLNTLGLFDRGRELTEPDALPLVDRLAFLHPPERAEDYAFFAAVISNRGTLVRAFGDDEAAALAWLAQDRAGGGSDGPQC